MSFLKPENETQETSFVSKGDLLTLLVIGLVVAGGYYYFQFAKKESFKKVEEAQKVYEGGDYVKALEAFRNLGDLSWKNDSLDSVIYVTHSILEDRRSNQRFLFQEIQDRIAKKDSAALPTLLEKFEGEEFLESGQKEQLVKWRSLFLESSVTPADSSKK